jgi:hypothetical protein
VIEAERRRINRVRIGKKLSSTGDTEDVVERSRTV